MLLGPIALSAPDCFHQMAGGTQNTQYKREEGETWTSSQLGQRRTTSERCGGEELWDSREDSADGDKLDILTTVIEAYERRHGVFEGPGSSLRHGFRRRCSPGFCSSTKKKRRSTVLDRDNLFTRGRGPESRFIESIVSVDLTSAQL